jgi:hypothetical protein
MSLTILPPPPGDDTKSYAWRDWFFKLQQAFKNAVFGIGQGGTGLSEIGTSNQVLGVNSTASGLEYKSIIAGSNISVGHGAGTITISASSSSAPSNSLTSDLTVSTDTSYVVIGYFNLNGYTANIDGNMEIL